MSDFKILIVGAGLGGLCLAQALRKANVDVAVYERDATPWDRPQGYRLHLDSDGVNALRQSLPHELFSLIEATSMVPLDYTTIIDTGLTVLRRMPSDDHGGTSSADHVNVNRATLRQILLAGLDEIVHFGATLERYESDDDGVTAIFADGTRFRGDILVGADGIRSAVRKQRMPQARTMDTGVRAIYGRIPIERARQCLPQQALDDVFTVAADARKIFLGLGPVVFPTRPELASPLLTPQEDYAVCIVGGRKEHFALDDAALRRASSVELQKLASKMLKDWPSPAAAVPAQGDPASFFFVEMQTSVPCEIGSSSNVTLLGDAIHAMTPTLGRGANIALRDAALLGRMLTLVSAGELDRLDAMRSYEDEMTRYGFGVVRQSALMGQRLMGQNALPG